MVAKKIMVVDDEPHVVTYLTDLFQDNGYETCSAPDGEEAFALLSKERPDLITLDVMMPRDSGIRMYRDIKTSPQWQKMPVLIISGVAKKTFLHSQKVLDQFKNQSVPHPEGYIEKPPEPEELLGEVKRILG